MSISDVTQRFLHCLDKLVETRNVRSKRQFALTLGYHAQGISEMAAHRRDVPIELIEKAISTYNFNPDYLFRGTGSLFRNPIDEDGLRLHHLTIVTDQRGDERIIHVPCQAQAGYGKSLSDPVFMQDLPSYRLPDPQFKAGTYRSFEVAGKSMEPTFMPNDIAIAAFIESRFWEQAIKNNQVHIIVTKEEVLIKRVINHIKTERIIDCVSDNPEFDSYTIRVNDIMEVWKVRMKLTSQFDQANSPFNTHDISRQLKAQQKMLENLQEHFSKSSMA